MKHRPFYPSRGGSAPAHLHLHFSDVLERYVLMPEGHPEEAALLAELQAITGKLWNCTDTMPNFVASEFDDLLGMNDVRPVTYAQGARFLRWHVARQKKAQEAKRQKSLLTLMASKRHLYVEGYVSKPRVRVKAIGRLVA